MKQAFLILFASTISVSLFSQQDSLEVKIAQDTLQIKKVPIQEFKNVSEEIHVPVLEYREDQEVLVDNKTIDIWDEVLNDPLKKLYEYDEADSAWIKSALNVIVSDSIFAQRLFHMDQKSPIHFVNNNSVRTMINVFVNRQKHQTALTLGRSKMYFPLYEQILDENEMPYELKYLSVIESALRPDAHSRMGAKGLWQFMYATGKAYGLDINSYVDERMDPEKSTRAACKYLKYLHGLYNDWNLALAAYNAGPGNVNKAIRRSGGKRDYWQIRRYLPRETRSYVPNFLAMAYTFEYAKEHQLRALPYPIAFYETDTLVVRKQISFANVARHTGMKVSELQLLNPEYKRNIIPMNSQGNVLRIPKAYLDEYFAAENAIAMEPVVQQLVTNYKKSSPKSNRDVTYYRVKSGDVLGTIAEKYGVGLSRLKAWNNIRGSRIHPGQKLTIYYTKMPTYSSKPAVTQTTQKETYASNTGKQYHTVRMGDTLWDIAKLYNGVSMYDLQKWNSHINFKKMKPGQRIIVKK